MAFNLHTALGCLHHGDPRIQRPRLARLRSCIAGMPTSTATPTGAHFGQLDCRFCLLDIGSQSQLGLTTRIFKAESVVGPWPVWRELRLHWVPSGERVLPLVCTFSSHLWHPGYSMASCKRLEVHFRTRPGGNRHTRAQRALPGVGNVNTAQPQRQAHLSVEETETWRSKVIWGPVCWLVAPHLFPERVRDGQDRLTPKMAFQPALGLRAGSARHTSGQASHGPSSPRQVPQPRPPTRALGQGVGPASAGSGRTLGSVEDAQLGLSSGQNKSEPGRV